MQLRKNISGIIILGVAGLGLASPASHALETQPGATVMASSMTELSSEAQGGEVLFNNNCAACHGANGSGTDKGPPLIHDIYNPGHHPDESFQSAARYGVPQHHWPFGNMPRQAQVEPEDVEKIIRYIRELQVANGIVFKEHRM